MKRRSWSFMRVVEPLPAKTRHTSFVALALGFHGFLKPAFSQNKVLMVVQEGQG